MAKPMANPVAISDDVNCLVAIHRAASPTQSAADPASASRRHLPGGANPNTAVTRVIATPAAADDGCDGIPLPWTPAVGNHSTVTLTRATEPANTAR